MIGEIVMKIWLNLVVRSGWSNKFFLVNLGES